MKSAIRLFLVCLVLSCCSCAEIINAAMFALDFNQRQQVNQSVINVNNAIASSLRRGK